MAKPLPYGSITSAVALKSSPQVTIRTIANVITATTARLLKYFRNPISLIIVVKKRSPKKIRIQNTRSTSGTRLANIEPNVITYNVRVPKLLAIMANLQIVLPAVP
jgi:hypothetical protein